MNERRPRRRRSVAVGLGYAHRVVDVLASAAIIGAGVTSTGATVVGIVYVAGFPASEWFHEVAVTSAVLAGAFLFATALSVSAYYVLYRVRGEHSHGGLLDGE